MDSFYFNIVSCIQKLLNPVGGVSTGTNIFSEAHASHSIRACSHKMNLSQVQSGWINI